MDFADDVERREVRLADGDRHILTLTVRAAGRLQISTRPSLMYTVLDGRLIEIRMPTVIESRFSLGRGRGHLEVGDNGHPVSETLHRLDVSPEAVGVVDSPVIRTMFVPGVAVGEGRSIVDFEGDDRDCGRFTVRHPGTGPIDRMPDSPLSAIWPLPTAASGRRPKRESPY
jgi:hypothetical protein